MSGRAGASRTLPALALLVAVLLACGGEIQQKDRDERTASCAKDPSFDAAASADALAQLRSGACRSTTFGTRCEDWWGYVITTCVFRSAESDGGGKRIEVHTPLSVDTDTAREKRESMCDAVRERISMSDRATIQNNRGNTMTTCGKPRRKP